MGGQVVYITFQFSFIDIVSVTIKASVEFRRCWSRQRYSANLRSCRCQRRSHSSSLYSVGACGGRGSGCSDVGSESTNNQTRCTLMSPKRQTCSVGKTASLRRAEIKNLVVFIWGCFLRQGLMGNELLCTQMCAGCAESIRFFFGKGPRARICLPSVYLMKYLCGSSGTMANVCALCSEEKVQTRRTKIEGNHFQYVCGGLIFFFFFFFPVPLRAGEETTAENRSFLPKCPHLLC